MQPLTHQKLLANAFRTLGLSASAGQAAVEAAARRMRIWPDPARVPPTPWDLPWLGPLSRTRNDVEQAVSRLSEPASRVEERLLWYHGPPPSPDAPVKVEPLAAPPDGPGPDPDPPARRHDAALAALHAASARDPDAVHGYRWRAALERFGALAASADYADWLERAEREGDFEKRAAPHEIAAAGRALPGALAAALAPKAQAALDRGDATTCAAVVEILRAAASRGPSPDDLTEPVRRLLDGMEDVLGAHCREMERGLRGKLRTNRHQPEGFYFANRVASAEAERYYTTIVWPALQTFAAVAADEPDRLTRVYSACGEVLALLALGWEWSGEFVRAESTLLSALDLADGTPAAIAIRRDLERCAPLAERERGGEQDRVADVEPAPAAAAAPRPAALKPAPRRTRPVLSGAAIFGVALAASWLLSLNGTGTRSPPPPVGSWVKPMAPPTLPELSQYLKGPHPPAGAPRRSTDGRLGPASNVTPRGVPEASPTSGLLEAVPEPDAESVGETNRE